MNTVKCQACGNEFPMNDTFEVSDSVLCRDCADQRLSENQDIPEDAIRLQIDPTVCAHCGKDNGSTPLPRTADLPTCDQCEDFFTNRPFPHWVKAAFGGLVFLVLFALIWNVRFIKAYSEMRRAGQSLVQGDIESSAADRVPESDDLRVMACYTRGLVLLNQDKSAEALRQFRVCRDKLPPEFALNQLVMSAKIGEAFDSKDYDEFLNLAMRQKANNPNDPMCEGQVASAYSCKFAVTGDEGFRQKALKALEQTRQLSRQHEYEQQFKEYEQRILHRLHSREVIKRAEFARRFPNGWEPQPKE
jgi:hypothetical protein